MVLEIGKCLTILDEFLEQEKLTGVWWKQLVVDMVAGAMSLEAQPLWTISRSSCRSTPPRLTG